MMVVVIPWEGGWEGGKVVLVGKVVMFFFGGEMGCVVVCFFWGGWGGATKKR